MAAKTDRRSQPRILKELPEEMIGRLAEKGFEASQILANEPMEALKRDLPVERFMSTDLINAAPTDTAAEIRDCMVERGFRHMLICEKDDQGSPRLRGVVSDRDVATRNHEPASQFMVAKPLTVTPATGVMHAATIMLNCRVSSVPVIAAEDSDTVVGVLTLTDVLLALNCLLPVIEGIAEQLSGLPPANSTSGVESALSMEKSLRSH